MLENEWASGGARLGLWQAPRWQSQTVAEDQLTRFLWPWAYYCAPSLSFLLSKLGIATDSGLTGLFWSLKDVMNMEVTYTNESLRRGFCLLLGRGNIPPTTIRSNSTFLKAQNDGTDYTNISFFRLLRPKLETSWILCPKVQFCKSASRYIFMASGSFPWVPHGKPSWPRGSACGQDAGKGLRWVVISGFSFFYQTLPNVSPSKRKWSSNRSLITNNCTSVKQIRNLK